MGRRTLLLITSVLVSAVGVALIGVYIRGDNTRANIRAEQIYGPPPTATATPSPTPTGQHPDIRHAGLTLDIQSSDLAIGLLQPGDLVDVYETPKHGTPRRVEHAVRVLSIGSATVITGPATANIPATIIGLDVSQAQVVNIKKAQRDGALFVTVLGAGEARQSASAPSSL